MRTESFSAPECFHLSVESFAEIRPGLVKQFKPGRKQPESLHQSLLVLSLPSVSVSLTQLKGLEKAFLQATCSDRRNPLEFSASRCVCRAWCTALIHGLCSSDPGSKRWSGAQHREAFSHLCHIGTSMGSTALASGRLRAPSHFSDLGKLLCTQILVSKLYEGTRF